MGWPTQPIMFGRPCNNFSRPGLQPRVATQDPLSRILCVSILLDLLDSLRKLNDKMHRESEDELVEHLYKILRPMKYLIVMDDVWNTEAWDDFRRGLPQAILVIGGLLSKLDCTYEVWENVAEKIHSITATAANRCWQILSLSYNQLPQRLKTCFLYKGIFLQDYEILVYKLIKLWVAEGFL
ncbi:putative late blight resistance protein-like protein R1B-14 [Forsythia ovata]|uniref:Late blight resistance protein-like protein R1B-14 n=1 Tax=Forsythia ovata TaxID=205694 RepID=A0ABD1TRT8_9LAMI